MCRLGHFDCAVAPARGKAHHAVDLLELAEVGVLLLDGSEAHLHWAEACERHLRAADEEVERR